MWCIGFQKTPGQEISILGGNDTNEKNNLVFGFISKTFFVAAKDTSLVGVQISLQSYDSTPLEQLFSKFISKQNNIMHEVLVLVFLIF